MLHLDMGACRDVDPSIMCPAPEDEGGARRARAVCTRCTVRLECLALALRTEHLDGVWGGLTASERERHGSTTRVRSARR